MRLAFLLLAGCGAVPMTIVDAGADAGTDAGFDFSKAGLAAFAASGAYKTWKAEPMVHASTGPHGGNVRTYVNDVLYASLKAGKTTHPPGSIAVKELYGSSTTAVNGHAVDAKDASGTWFFFEESFYFSGTSNFCAGCHSAGPDFYAGPIATLP